MRTGRNEPCPCGSGRKYKKCCIGPAVEPDTSVSPTGRLARHEPQPHRKRPKKLFPHQLEAMLIGLQASSDRRLEEHREREFLRSEFKRLGKTDEQINKILGR